MGYEEMFSNESDVTNATKIGYDIFSFRTAGDTIIGKIEKSEQFQGGKFRKNPATKYYFDTDKGKYTVLLSKSFNDKYGEEMKIGRVVKIVYKGQIKTQNRHLCNQYEVFVIGKSEVIKNTDIDTKVNEPPSENSAKKGVFKK